ncbi:MAG: hypothetical protein ACI9U0_000830 [Flavobacteriales bacterium]|jgi:hypothetical protein
MMKKKLVSIIGVSSLSIILAACGGSSDNDSVENSTNYIPPISSNVSGQFFNSNDTGKYFSTEDSPSYEQYGQNARHCYQSYNDYYFESEKTMVFGNPNLPQSDFKQAATWVENNLASALTAMGISEQEFFDAKSSIRLSRLKEIRNWLSQKAYDDFTYPTEFDNWTSQQQNDWATKTTKDLTVDEIVNLTKSDPYTQHETENDYKLENKIYVCLHENTQPYGWGEGTAIGITIGAESIVVPDDINKLIQHELIHTIQHAISADIDGFKLPRWFSEGQAVYLSGMSVAKKANHNEYDPTLVVSFYDEYGDPSLSYEHYGLAYQYLNDANSQPSILAMMRDLKVRTFDFSLQLNSELDENHNYVEAFNVHINQQNGNSLSVSEYRDNYHSLMSNYAN